MRISQSCADCLYRRQKNKTDNAGYLAEIKSLLDNRRETDTSPYMVYLFNKAHIKYFGKSADYSDIKKQYNDLVLSMEDSLRREISSAEDPLASALIMARINEARLKKGYLVEGDGAQKKYIPIGRKNTR